MRHVNSESLQAQDLRIEYDVLREIVDLRPDHLTCDELVVRLEDEPTDTDPVAIMDSLHALKRSGLARCNGEVIEPTHAAVRAVEIFDSR
jgi:hypothetical protein